MVIDLLWFTKRNTRQILHCKTFKKLSILYFWLKSLWDVFLLWRLPCMIPGLVSSTLVCGYLCSSFREFGGLGVWWNRQRISLFWIVRKQLSFDFPHTFYCISFSPSSSSSNSFFYVTVIWDWHYHCRPTLVYVKLNSHQSFFCLGQEVSQDLRLAVIPLLPVDHLTSQCSYRYFNIITISFKFHLIISIDSSTLLKLKKNSLTECHWRTQKHRSVISFSTIKNLFYNGTNDSMVVRGSSWSHRCK